MLGSLRRNTGVDDRTTMWQTTVVTLHLLSSDEVNGGVVIREVVWHGLDLVLDTSKISAFLSYYEALTRMLLTGSKFWILSGTNTL